MYEDAKRVLTEDAAVVVAIDQREYSDTVVVHRKWENIPVEKSKEYIDYLNASERSITDPSNIPAGTYKVLRNVYMNDDGEREIHQYLAANLYTTAPYASTTTKWRIFQGINYHSGTSKLILEMPDFDPAYVREVSEALPVSPDSFTNSIYTVSDGLISGTWYNRTSDYHIDERGVGVLRWTLSKYNNDDLHFSYYDRTGRNVVEFFKFEATDSSMASFETDYWFDGLGNWYIAADGVNYTSKNGTATASTPLAGEPGYGTTLGSIRTSVKGRGIPEVQVNRNPETGAYMLHLKLTFETDIVGVAHYLRNPFERVVDFFLLGQDEDDLHANFQRYYFNASGDWYYSSDGVNYTIANGSAASGTLASVNAFNPGQDDTDNGYRECAVDAQKNQDSNVWALRARMVYPTPRSAVVINHPNGDITYLGFWAAALPDFSALAGSYIVTTVRVEQLPNGLYNYVFVARPVNSTSGLTAGYNTTVYGTPDVTVTDTLVHGVANLPASAGTPAYNSAGTKVTETQILNPKYDPATMTFSYLQRVVETWAPKSDHGTGAAGYTEGPSEIAVRTQTATLARGVGSGVAALGSWSGGGHAITYNVVDADGGWVNADGRGHVTKKFSPYNVTISRACMTRTSSRVYFFVEPPTESQYPAAFADAVENIDAFTVAAADVLDIHTDITKSFNGTGSEAAPDENDTMTVAILYPGDFATEVVYTATLGTGPAGAGSVMYWKLTSITTYSDYSTTPVEEYKGHYRQDTATFFTEAVRHRIVKMAENLYGLFIDTVERTAWQVDRVNSWILNPEGDSKRFLLPPADHVPAIDYTEDIPPVI